MTIEKIQIEKVSAGYYCVKGRLSFNSVPELWRDNKDELFSNNENLIIDFSQLTRSDSSGLALLVEWYREATQNGQKITFTNLPEKMLHVAEVCALDEFLPIKK